MNVNPTTSWRAATSSILSSRPSYPMTHEAHPIHRRDLVLQLGSQVSEAEGLQVFVEVAHARRQSERLDACGFGTLGQCRKRHVTRGVSVAGDVEPAQCGRKQKGGKVVAPTSKRNITRAAIYSNQRSPAPMQPRMVFSVMKYAPPHEEETRG